MLGSGSRELTETILTEAGGDWHQILAMIAVESSFRTEAVSPAGARGLMQVTDIARVDAERTCGELFPNLHDPRQGVRAGMCYLIYLRQTHNLLETEQVIAYNGGIRQLLNFYAGGRVADETLNYVIRYYIIKETCNEETTPCSYPAPDPACYD